MTKPDRKTIKNILDDIDRLLLLDDQCQERFNDLFILIASDSNPPIINQLTATSNYIDGVRAIDPDLAGELEYYAYELSSMEEAEGEKKGKKYDLKDREEFIDFILD